jgi:hypothetical protein
MNKLLVLVLILLLTNLYLSIQQNNDFSSLRKKAQNTTTIYNNTKQGYFEEIMYEFSDYSGIKVDFKIFANHPGESSSFVGLSLYDQTRDDMISLRYINTDNDEYLRLIVNINSEIDLSEYIELPSKINSIKITWEDNNISFNTDYFDHIMNIPFEPSLIAITNASNEILNTITFIEKKEDE